MKNPVHPGEVLHEDAFEDLGLKVAVAAQLLGVVPDDLAKVVAA